MDRWVRLIGVCASLAMIAASMAMNGIYMFRIGQTVIEGAVLAMVSVSADSMKAVLPVRIAMMWRERQYVRVAGASVLELILFALAVMAALGYAVENRDTVAGRRDVRANERAMATREVERIERELAQVGPSRPRGALEEELKRLRMDPVFGRSKQCSEPTGPVSRDWCSSYRKVSAELASAEDKARLEGELRGAKAELAGLTKGRIEQGGALLERLLHRLTGVAETAFHDGWMVGLVLMIELTASLGLLFSMGDSRVGFTKLPVPPEDQRQGPAKMIWKAGFNRARAGKDEGANEGSGGRLAAVSVQRTSG